MKKRKFHIYSFLFLTAIVCLANWSLLFETNLMKWDIMDSHYPNSMFLSDSIRSGNFPLWNPLFRYGSPHYANVGMPVYYPITFILALIGYDVGMVGVEYCIHVVLACFGMYLFTYYDMKQSKKQNIRWVYILSVVVGLFYGFSTVFISNAQHIMILISATWLPYVLLFLRRYLLEKATRELLFAAMFMSLSIQGGYPELWVASFLIIIPYVVFYIEKNDDKIYKILLRAGLVYVSFFVLTCIAGAVTLVPFVKMSSELVRMSGGMVVYSYSVGYLFSMVLPGFWNYFKEYITIDRSMVSMYMGLITVISMPAIVIRKNKKNYFNIGIIIFSFLMMMGNNAFLHPLFYKYFPGFSTLRFPSLWRCVVVVFTLELMADFWYELLTVGRRKNVVIISGIIGVFLSFLAGVFLHYKDFSNMILEQKELEKVLFTISIFFFLYSLLLLLSNKEKRANQIFVLIMLCEMLVVFNYESLVTIIRYKPKETIVNQELKDYVDSFFVASENRNRSMEFSESNRSNGKKSSIDTILQKSLAEEGYISARMGRIDNYLQSANRFITQKNPEAYFTDDVVTSSEVEFKEWVNDWSISNTQIYIEESDYERTDTFTETLGKEKVINSQHVEYQEIEGKNICERVFAPLEDSSVYRYLKIYFSDYDKADCVNISFYQNMELKNEYSIKLSNVKKDKNGDFVYAYFPQEIEYTSIVIEPSKVVIGTIVYEEADRIKKAENVYINSLVPDYVKISTKTDYDGYLVLLQTVYDGWKIYVDGIEADMDIVNECFMGVYLEAGQHIVEYKFVPLDFYIGMSMTVVFFMFVLYVLIRKKNVR